jgi:hypothetical protein
MPRLLKVPKGKCFSAVDRGQRKKSDFYCTPWSMVKQLLENEMWDRTASILEPCSGNEDISSFLLRQGFDYITFYDIQNGNDFLQEKGKYSYIITNPPFSLAKEFILKCKEVCKKKFALLLPLSYLHGEERYHKIWGDAEYPLKKVYVFTRYPMLSEKTRKDGKYSTGMVVYAWYVWEKGYIGPATIDWISNQQYILSKKDKESEND